MTSNHLEKIWHKFNTPCDKKISTSGEHQGLFFSLIEKLVGRYFGEFKLFGYGDDTRSVQNTLVGDVSFASVTYDYVTDDLTLSNLWPKCLSIEAWPYLGNFQSLIGYCYLFTRWIVSESVFSDSIRSSFWHTVRLFHLFFWV